MALLAVAPLFLFPFFGDDVTAAVLLWLSLIAATWVVMAPACRPGEMPHNARTRLCRSVVSDPVTWFMLVAVGFAGMRALNGGIAYAYDAESMVWYIRSPSVEILPGCVKGCGFLPFAVSVALAVLLLGTRHALGGASSDTFFVSATFMAGVAAIVSAIALSYGSSKVVEMVSCSYENPYFAGTAYGVHLVGGVVALFGCAEAGWRRAEPLAAFGLVCSAVGLALFSPPATFAVFAVAFVLMYLVAFPLTKGRFIDSAALRCAVALLTVVAAVVLVSMLGENFGSLGDKRDSLLSMKFFPEGFAKTRDAISSIALKSWKSSPWLGAGLGSFPIDLRFVASQADWALISPRQAAALNGWWQLLLERGIAGALVFAVGAGFLAWAYFARLAGSFGCGRWRPVCLLAPLLALALVALAFIDCSFLRPDVLLPAVAAISLSAGAFRQKSRNLDNPGE